MLDECGARGVYAINDAADDYRVETAIIETVRQNRISKRTSNRSSTFRYQTYVVVRFFSHPVRHFKHRQAAEDHDLKVWNDDVTDAQHDKSWKVVQPTLRLTRGDSTVDTDVMRTTAQVWPELSDIRPSDCISRFYTERVPEFTHPYSRQPYG